jgi:predicted acylesterase/phospholipase RssA
MSGRQSDLPSTVSQITKKIMHITRYEREYGQPQDHRYRPPMNPCRKVALAIDGGGIRGVIAAKALAVVEKHLGKPIRNIAGLVAGTSTGSIISGGIASGLSARYSDLYLSSEGSVPKDRALLPVAPDAASVLRRSPAKGPERKLRGEKAG